MSKAFVNAMIDDSVKSVTENGMECYNSTTNACLDFFALAGAMRGRSSEDVIAIFSKALADDEKIALKLLFWVRDCRGGAGERKIFRTILNFLGKVHPDTIKNYLSYIPEYGRWDDLFCLFDTQLEQDMLVLIKSKFLNDKPDYTIAKWMPSVNTTSKATVMLAKRFCKAFGLSEKVYRKTLSKLRKDSVVEVKMSANKWSDIEYSAVPSYAMKNYTDAFTKHDNDRFANFIKKVEKGEEKINASTLYPYDILAEVKRKYVPTHEAQWKALPDYFKGEPANILPMIDVSGSMTCSLCPGTSVTPMDAAISLGMYCAERNTGSFKDVFMTFSSDPQIVKIMGKTLYEKYNNISKASWNMSTNIEGALLKVLELGLVNKVKDADMPKALLIISDMNFNECCYGDNNFNGILSRFDAVNYSRPTIIFWNVNANQNIIHAKKENAGIILISGLSPSILTSVLSLNKSMVEVMMDKIAKYSFII